MTLSELYECYEAYLWRQAMRLTQDADQADDLVQETFMRSMGHLQLLGLLKPYQQRAWLKRTLKNLFLDAENARRRKEALVGQLILAEPTVQAAPSVRSQNPFDLVPDRFRNVVEMRYVQGMNSREIGEALSLPPETVRSRLHLALKHLRAFKARLC